MGLSFDQLSKANLHRCTQEFKHPLSLWRIGDWAAATAGECGEACNIAKKITRIRTGLAQFNKDNMVGWQYKQALAKELADLVIYTDLWAQSEDINLGQAIIDKFNEDSDKHGVACKL